MKYYITLLLLTTLSVMNVYSQVEVAPWGNVTGIRKGGQLFPFETSIKLIKSDGEQILTTAHERQRPRYRRDDKSQIVNTDLDSLHFEITVTDDGGGKAKVHTRLTSGIDTTLTGIYFAVRIPFFVNSQSTLRLSEGEYVKLPDLTSNPVISLKGIASHSIEFKNRAFELKVKADDKEPIILNKDYINGVEGIMVYFPIRLDSIRKGEIIEKNYELQVNGEVDKQQVTINVNTGRQGKAFDGLGGNFRLQNPTTDPQVIDYSLNNLRVAWGRVEMPWKLWEPLLDVKPETIHPEIIKAMEMAQRLQKQGMPVIVSAWTAPDWAIVGAPNPEPVNGIWGNPLRSEMMPQIYLSITDYLLYLKKNYGVEAKFFSFNESDLGINIRMTAQEHADFIKGIGAYFASKGLSTKLLLGDNSDATTYQFIQTAMNDAQTLSYVGAVSFHSWRGTTDENLLKWAGAAERLNLPLLVGEGSIDAAAWQYPAIFEEPTYALQEISLYTRLLAICQPASILQWQLTADYSPMAGGGIFGNNAPLHPTQRFWNLKQLASTPKGLYTLPVTCNRPAIVCAALGDNSKQTYAFHLVNNGAERQVVITGLPKQLKAMQIYITDKDNNMKLEDTKKTSNGQLKFKMPSTSYVTLISE